MQVYLNLTLPSALNPAWVTIFWKEAIQLYEQRLRPLITSLDHSFLIPSFLGSPSTNPVHPPPSTAPTSETLGPTKHPGTPVFTISCLTSKQPLGLSTPLNPVRQNYYLRI
ncbi:hypothetical protein CHARACLAT_028047 [Characodon lateralis]|uniref:Uncharacterized protein n=1 Tax=Characodon lateralis TaxID=208331 RepID=A0ABU7E785_9TELE|nr:hypothetical protein [Characodon lateralis]